MIYINVNCEVKYYEKEIVLIILLCVANTLFSQNKWEVISQVTPHPKQIRIVDTNSWFIAKPTTSVWESGKDRGIVISPNPASDFIIISFQTSEVSSVQIFDMLGLEVAQTHSSVNNMKNTKQGASEQLRINVSHLPLGVYFIRIGNKVEKFVKI